MMGRPLKMRRLKPVELRNVRIEGGLLAARQETNREVTLPIARAHCQRTGRIAAFGLDWKHERPNKPHYYWDSDVAKWIEAASYSLINHPDPELESQVGNVVDLVVAAQQPDGYLNSYFTTVEPSGRFCNLYEKHELYCAGHLIEAAIAWREATGGNAFLAAMIRYVDLIDSQFGPDEGKRRGYPGHQEIELALVRLFRVTGDPKHLALARYFVDERGSFPNYFDEEAFSRGEPPRQIEGTWEEITGRHSRFQAHAPIREQRTVEGHAVRAMYYYAGAADVAAETSDAELQAVCRALWTNVVARRMYVTGGVGSSNENERFTFDYDLPNETGYCESCAAVGLILWAHRMLQMDADAAFGDIVERALYNCVLSGVSESGDRFFYANPLEVFPQAHHYQTLTGIKEHFRPVRQPWFDTACCPPNIARLLASLGAYLYSTLADEIFVHLYASSAVTVTVAGDEITIVQNTRYPWDGTVQIRVTSERDVEFTLALRLPGWCRKEGVQLEVNGAAVDTVVSARDRGYLRLNRRWTNGDVVRLVLPMPVERVYSHPSVRQNAGRIALQRGPVIYCLEETDNGTGLATLFVPKEGDLDPVFEPNLLGGVVTVSGRGLRSVASGWESTLYRCVRPETEVVEIRAIPYFAWGNRDPGEMIVWVRGG